MGDKGMADMRAMEMPLPDNTLPMMSGEGPFGPLEMGGMFSVAKARDEVQHGDYADPGWYRHPPGEQAYEFTGTPQAPQRAAALAADARTLTVRKPGAHGPH